MLFTTKWTLELTVDSETGIACIQNWQTKNSDSEFPARKAANDENIQNQTGKAANNWSVQKSGNPYGYITEDDDSL